MTRGRRISRHARFSPRWALERLEERILLSGNVTASVTSSGNLAVVGLAKGSEILIQSTAGGALQVSSLDGTTTINGSTSPFTTSAVTGDVDVFMLQTNDVVDVGGSGTLTNLPHNLAVIMLGGSDTVAVENATIGGSVTLFGMLGSDTFTVGGTSSQALVTVDGNVSIFGGTGPTNTMAVFNANIDGNLNIASNGVDDDIQVGFDAGLGIIGETAPAHVNVGGNLNITTPQSGGFLGFLGALSFGGFGAASLSFNGGNGFQFSLPGAGSFGSFNSFGAFGCGNVLACDLAFFGGWCGGGGDWGGGGCGQGPGPGSDSTGQTVALADVSVTGNANIQTGSGSSLILLGAAPLPSGSTSPLNLVFGPVTVGANLKVNAGNGNDTIFADGITVTGNTGITTGRGNDDIAILGNDGFFNGTFTLSAGPGNDSIAIINGATFLSTVTISAGRGSNIMWVAQDLFLGPVTINGGPGSNTLLESENVYPNSFLPGYPVLNSIQTVMLDVSPTDPIITTNFGWLNTLLGV
jgi:hypothetical protein